MNVLPPPAPECKKLGEISDESQLIGEFLDWLTNTKHASIEWDEVETWEVPCSKPQRLWEETVQVHADTGGKKLSAHPMDCKCGGTGKETKTRREAVRMRSIERLLAEYYDIDLDLVEREKLAVLEWIRERNAES